MRDITRAIILILLLLPAGTGCFLLGGDPPRQRHYVLGQSGLEADEAPSEDRPGVTVGLRKLQLDSYLETPFIVVREGPHQVTFSELHRWGEDLSRGINRMVAGDLASRASFRGVDVVPLPPQAKYDYLIQIHVLRFEGLAPEDPAATQGGAHLLATWEIIRQQDGEVLVRGTTDHRANGWTVGDYDGLVSLLNAGLGVLSDDLVTKLETLVASQ